MDYEQIESSQRQHHETLRQQEAMFSLVEQSEYNLFSTLKPKLYKVGKEWWVLYGKDEVSGILGVGDTPYKAILNWNQQFHKSAKKQDMIKKIKQICRDIRLFLIQFWACKVWSFHNWTCAVTEGEKPTPEQLNNGVEGFLDYATMYCRRCGTVSKLSIQQKQKWELQNSDLN